MLTLYHQVRRGYCSSRSYLGLGGDEDPAGGHHTGSRPPGKSCPAVALNSVGFTARAFGLRSADW